MSCICVLIETYSKADKTSNKPKQNRNGSLIRAHVVFKKIPLDKSQTNSTEAPKIISDIKKNGDELFSSACPKEQSLRRNPQLVAGL